MITQRFRRYHGVGVALLLGVTLVLVQGCSSNFLSDADTRSAAAGAPGDDVLGDDVLGDDTAAFQSRRVEFLTEDRVSIVGDLYGDDRGAPVVIALPMYRSTRDTWKPLVPALRAAGVNFLALDLRGHGESGPEFIDPVRARDSEVFRVMWRDVEAARGFLEARGYDTTRVGLVGASVGCSVALRTMLRNPGPYRCGVLLTPGAKYLGVDSLSDASAWRGAPLLVLTSTEEESNVAEVTAAFSGWGDVVQARTFPGSGLHGTRMLGKVPGVEETISGFLRSQLSQLHIPRFAPEDPAIKTAGFFGKTLTVPLQAGESEFRLMAYAIGESLTLGGMYKGDRFEGEVTFELGELTVTFPFDTQKPSAAPITGRVVVTSATPESTPPRIVAHQAGFRGTRWLTFELPLASVSRVMVRFDPREEQAVQIPKGGAYGITAVSKGSNGDKQSDR